jgi:hypothetical protein
LNTHFRRGFLEAGQILGRLWPLAAAAAGLVLLIVAAVLEGRAIGTAASARAAQLRLLHGVAFGIILPLYAWGTSARLGGGRDQLMSNRWARHGGDRRVYALGRLARAALLDGAVAGLFGALAIGLGSATSAPGDELPTSMLNVLTVLWVGLLGGIAYTVMLALAHEYMGSAGRLSLLAADWILGSGTSLLALPLPRAHLRALLGGPVPFGLAPGQCALCLIAISALGAVAYVRRLPP